MPMPRGASLTVKRVEEKGSHQTMSEAADGSFMMVRGTEDGVERRAVAVPADLAPGAARRNAWLSRWTMETWERRLGPMPTVTLQESRTLMVALLPTLPPVPVDGDGRPQSAVPQESYAVEFDDGAFLDEIARRLDAEADLNEVTLVEAVTHQPVGLRSEGWILVVCHEDGTARYDLAPLGAWGPLTNPSLFCAAIESILGGSERE